MVPYNRKKDIDKNSLNNLKYLKKEENNNLATDFKKEKLNILETNSKIDDNNIEGIKLQI